MRDIHPKRDWLVVEPVERGDTVTPGGVVVPEQAQEQPSEGTVVAVGPLVGDVEVGEVVFYAKYAGTPFELNGRDVVLLKDADVILRITERLVALAGE